jgi:hypothetical protein
VEGHQWFSKSLYGVLIHLEQGLSNRIRLLDEPDVHVGDAALCFRERRVEVGICDEFGPRTRIGVVGQAKAQGLAAFAERGP